jgi:hypothetical protein
MTTQPEPEWTVERGAGWVQATRTKPHVTVLAESKSVHIHYWTTDDELDRDRQGIADLVCHGCDQALRVIYPWFSAESANNEPFRPIREAFVHDHRKHVQLGHEFLCPPAYAVHETRDLR